jgi:hypothetical protein
MTNDKHCDIYYSVNNLYERIIIMHPMKKNKNTSCSCNNMKTYIISEKKNQKK